jgi:hypothetical protein
MGVGLGRCRERGWGGCRTSQRRSRARRRRMRPTTRRRPPPPPPLPPRTRRAFNATRWNSYAARRKTPPVCAAREPTKRPSTSTELECTHRSTSSRDGAAASLPVNAS